LRFSRNGIRIKVVLQVGQVKLHRYQDYIWARRIRFYDWRIEIEAVWEG
jgi:hypothetical protein